MLNMIDEPTDDSSDYFEMDEELYNRLAKLRNNGSSKTRLKKLLEEENHPSDEAKLIVERIEEDFRDYKNDIAKKYRNYTLISIVLGTAIVISMLLLLGKVHVFIIVLALAVVGYFLNKYLMIKSDLSNLSAICE